MTKPNAFYNFICQWKAKTRAAVRASSAELPKHPGKTSTTFNVAGDGDGEDEIEYLARTSGQAKPIDPNTHARMLDDMYKRQRQAMARERAQHIRRYARGC